MTRPEKIKQALRRHSAGNLLMVDVGAKEQLEYIPGLEAISIMHAFEPNPAEFALLKQKYKDHVFNALFLNDTGLSDKRGNSSFSIAHRASMSSLLEADLENYRKHFGQYKEFDSWKKNIEQAKKIEIRLETLTEYFKDNKEQIDYLKIDTQGTELLILKGAEELLKNKRISVIKLEVTTIPVYKNQALFSDIDLYLRSLGYAMVDFITYQDEQFSVFGNRGAEHAGPCGDAVYMADAQLPDSGHLLKKSLVLAWLGYTSIGSAIMDEIKTGAADKKILLALSQPSIAQQIKQVVKSILPPALLRLVKKLAR